MKTIRPIAQRPPAPVSEVKASGQDRARDASALGPAVLALARETTGCRETTAEKGTCPIATLPGEGILGKGSDIWGGAEMLLKPVH